MPSLTLHRSTVRRLELGGTLLMGLAVVTILRAAAEYGDSPTTMWRTRAVLGGYELYFAAESMSYSHRYHAASGSPAASRKKSPERPAYPIKALVGALVPILTCH